MNDKLIERNGDDTWSVWVNSQLGYIEVFTGTYEECIEWDWNNG